MQKVGPTLSGEWADPFLLQDGEDYYLYPTRDSDGWLYDKFHVFRSKDLVNWDGPYLALDLADVAWAETRAWAPGVNKHNGLYYMYFSAEAQIGAAVSESPLGPFRDLLGEPLIAANQYGCQSIDADLFIDATTSLICYGGRGSAGSLLWRMIWSPLSQSRSLCRTSSIASKAGVRTSRIKGYTMKGRICRKSTANTCLPGAITILGIRDIRSAMQPVTLFTVLISLLRIIALLVRPSVISVRVMQAWRSTGTDGCFVIIVSSIPLVRCFGRRASARCGSMRAAYRQ
ncbi:glycosyl hydrolase family 43 [Cohnella sp. SGD-V74]|nr:glycosyl hydrolase family 43 [Cohnella sp. SGD-V74]